MQSLHPSQPQGKSFISSFFPLHLHTPTTTSNSQLLCEAPQAGKNQSSRAGAQKFSSALSHLKLMSCSRCQASFPALKLNFLKEHCWLVAMPASSVLGLLRHSSCTGGSSGAHAICIHTRLMTGICASVHKLRFQISPVQNTFKKSSFQFHLTTPLLK